MKWRGLGIGRTLLAVCWSHGADHEFLLELSRGLGKLFEGVSGRTALGYMR